MRFLEEIFLKLKWDEIRISYAENKKRLLFRLSAIWKCWKCFESGRHSRRGAFAQQLSNHICCTHTARQSGNHYIFSENCFWNLKIDRRRSRLDRSYRRTASNETLESALKIYIRGEDFRVFFQYNSLTSWTKNDEQTAAMTIYPFTATADVELPPAATIKGFYRRQDRLYSVHDTSGIWYRNYCQWISR